MEYLESTFIFLLSVVSLYYYFHEKNGIPSKWPFVGMLPAHLINLDRIHDYFAGIVEKSNLTFLFKGPWSTNMQILATVDPANIHHVMSKNFGNYPKGPKFNEIFDVLGEGIFNTDYNMWEYHRKMSHSFFGHPKFNQLLLRKLDEKVENGIIPVLDYVSKEGTELDLQDLFGRFTLDTICSITMNYDPLSLSANLPSVPASKALDDLEEAIFYRHALPSCVWKFQRWLEVGLEKKYKKASQILDTFIYKCIAIKRESISKGSPYVEVDNEIGNDLLTSYMEENAKGATLDIKGDKFLRDTILNIFIAGRDTTSTGLTWFFYLITRNPQVLSKIRKELNEVNEFYQGSAKPSTDFYNKLVYLHATLCETLRLYPPVVFQVKNPTEQDILPSGHKVTPDMQIMFNLYAMARMKSIWGDDCHEFKPERWISDRKKIKHEPSYKFLAFNAGPRTCLGRDMAFTQMKVVAVAIISKYNIIPVEGCNIVPDLSIILHMKHGLKVKIVPLSNITI